MDILSEKNFLLATLFILIGFSILFFPLESAEAANAKQFGPATKAKYLLT
jgi:hypothetical protein